MRWIKDSIHGDVFVSSIADALLDTETMQRLRRVEQTSFANLIYPGANHTRFEHSIGVYYLTSRLGYFLDHLPKQEGGKLVIAGLLHDIGHTAFSHALEGVLQNHTGKSHEEFTRKKILSGEIAEVLTEKGIAPEDITSIYDSSLNKVIHGYLGTDKMDYLLRDSYYTGVAYGSVDADRILRKIKIHNNGVVLEEKGVSAAEAMLMARFLMYPNVYFHSAAMSAERMLTRATEDLIERNLLQAEELTQLDDWQTLYKMRDAGGMAGELATRIQTRKLYKVATQKNMKEFRNWLYLGDLTNQEVKEAEEEIAAKASVPAEQVILRVPKPWFRDVGIKVLKNGDYYSLDETSLITRLLKEAQWDYMNVVAFCPEEHREAVSRVDLSFLEGYGVE